MCGIAGLARFDGSPVDRALLRRMGAALAHRGPDGDGLHVHGGVGFAHRRLAIIDPTGGRQPLVDEHDGTAINYNGEVYNYPELRRDLGHAAFATSCDTEVVLRAYQQWGVSCLDRLRGMFAFALHDPRAGRLLLVRDRLGIKPLYYATDGDGIAFASELGALTPATPARRINRTALSAYLRDGYVPTPLTIYEGVHKLEPGCYLDVDLRRGVVAQRRYWQLRPAVRRRDEGAALEELNALLDEIVRLYVRSDVRFGAFLSGGVDSSLVTALMRRQLTQPVRTFTIGFQEAAYSELGFAAQASRALGTDHHAEVVSGQVAADLLERVARHFGEPFADSSAIPTFQVCRLAAGQVKMVLSGDGGDELFGGYDSYPLVFRRTRDPRAAWEARVFAGLRRVRLPARLRRAAETRGRGWQEIHRAHREIFSAAERGRLLGLASPAEDGGRSPQAGDGTDPVLHCQHEDVSTCLLDDILTKVDRMSMANSLEVRVPLLDHTLVEFAFSLPLPLRLRPADGDGITTKYLLKRSTERFLPRSALDRPKMGFGIPVRLWLDGALGDMARDLLDTSTGPLADHLDPDAVRPLVRRYYAGERELAALVWNLLSLRLWFDAVHAPAPARG